MSVIGSTGDALSIETTALAVLAWLQNPSFTANVEKAIRYLAEQCKAGRFGTTQSTILALKAIIAYDQSRAVPRAPGQLELVIDRTPRGEPGQVRRRDAGRDFAAEAPGAVGRKPHCRDPHDRRFADAVFSRRPLLATEARVLRRLPATPGSFAGESQAMPKVQ